MKNTLSVITMIFISGFLHPVFGIKYNENRANSDSLQINPGSIGILFWNAENLYDIYNDSLKNDEEFTSGGAKHWNWNRFNKKLNQVAKTILAAGEWDPPAIIGMCEIENRYVINKLIYETPLKTFRYKVVHHESADARGVDVALLYRPDLITVLSERSISVIFPFDTTVRTRDLLYVKCIVCKTDTIHLFVNHWPSRRGGQQASEPRRMFVATLLRSAFDSICLHNKEANIVAMGDFNDEPEDISLRESLGARTDTMITALTAIYNLMGIRNLIRREGTLKFRDQWSTFDQFIVSGGLFSGRQGLQAGAASVKIIRASFLLTEDEQYFGSKLKRTYSGPRYTGGFSDHLPVFLKVFRLKSKE